jgi:alpha-glucosidase
VEETRVLDGTMGEYIVTARRDGSSWYVGGMTNWTARSVTLDLGFLPAGKKYRAVLFADGVNAGKVATDYKVQEMDVDSATRLPVEMASGGGFAMSIVEK